MKGDVVPYALIAAITAVLFIIAGLQSCHKPAPKTAEVYVNNVFYASYDMSKDGEYTIGGQDGSPLLVLVIKDGIARAVESTCPDHLCEDMHPELGGHIVCLPKGVVVVLSDRPPELVIGG
jgi:hypothetical protein